MTRYLSPYMRRRPIDEAARKTVAHYLAMRFRDVPSPVEELLWAKRLGGHLGVRLVLFDGVPCFLILGEGGEERWVYRGLPPTFDTRPFFFHRMRAAWMRTGDTKEETFVRHGLDFV